MSNMVQAGEHRLTYRDYKGEHVDIKVSSVSVFEGPWHDVTKVMIPEGKKPFVKCPKCQSDNWTDDSAHVNGFQCDSCMFEILAV